MKATFLTSVFAVLVATTNLNAQNVKVFSNNECDANGTKKEFVTLDRETSKPLTKDFYNYDADGRIQEKTVSKWNDNKGWVNSVRYEYQYNQSGKVANVVYTKWDNKADAWAATSDMLVHIYDENDEFLSLKQTKINNTISSYNFITLK